MFKAKFMQMAKRVPKCQIQIVICLQKAMFDFRGFAQGQIATLL